MTPIRVVPTLAVMREVYSLSREGGPSSPRFQRYVELGRARVPVSGYNPMTSKDVVGTIDDPAVAHALDVLGQDTALATSAAVLYGDEVAQQMGWTPLGLGPWAGYRHCIARAREAMAEWSLDQLVRRRGR